MRSICPLLIVSVMASAACGGAPSADRTRAAGSVRWIPRGAADGIAPPLRLTLEPGGDSVVLRDAATAVTRGIVRSAADSADRDGVCALTAAGGGALARIRHALPIDTTVPWLAVTRLVSPQVIGTRALLPGSRAVYLFEGVFRGSRRRISLQWPVVSEHTVPSGAPVSALEQAIRPAPAELDALVLGLAEEGQGAVPPRTPIGDPDPVRATPLVGDLPVHEVRLDAPCRRVTLTLPVIARVDKLIRIPVRAGDTVTAMARVNEGTVRLAFDEVPAVPEPRERRSIPGARVVAAIDGRVTLRIRVQVVPRAQATGQLVTLLLDMP